MTGIGKVTTIDGTHCAECARENCDWTFESTRPGKAAHELMEHSAREHS